MGFVKGNGTTDVKHDYEFVVPNLTPGVYYFRLRMLDNDGTFTYSAVQSLTIRAAFDVSILPNPVQQEMTVNIVQENNASCGITLVNALGQVTELLAPRAISKGQTTLHFDLSNFPAGVYFCICKSEGDQTKTIRIVKD